MTLPYDHAAVAELRAELEARRDVCLKQLEQEVEIPQIYRIQGQLEELRRLLATVDVKWRPLARA